MTNKDTIYRQDAIKTIKDANVFVAYHEKDPTEEAVDRAIRATKRSVIYDIETLPSAEQCITATSNTMVSDTVKIPVMDGTTERKKGTYTESEENDEWYCWYATCNECGREWMGSRNFCPNCGADMREGEESE